MKERRKINIKNDCFFLVFLFKPLLFMLKFVCSYNPPDSENKPVKRHHTSYLTYANSPKNDDGNTSNCLNRKIF